MKKYNVIGDIHGRTCWKQLVNDDEINIFVGDYFDPYEKIPFTDLMTNFQEILKYKLSNPNTILLYGNHDDAYIHSYNNYSRHDRQHALKIKQIFSDTANLFSIAFATENYLITHAGVTEEWFNQYIPNVEKTPKQLAKAINQLWIRGKKECFDFTHNCTYFDSSGTSAQQSCMWVRPETLVSYNIFKETNYKQIVGHTQFKEIVNFENITFIDCLGTIIKSFKFNDNE